MAFPTIPTVGAGRVLSTNIDGTGTRTFPDLSGLTKNSGDLLIAIIVAYQSSSGAGAPGGTVFSSWGASFTEFCDQMTTNSSTMAIGAAYKWSTGSESGTFTVAQAATIAGGASLILLSIPGVHASTPPEAGTIANGTTGAADPGSFDPAGWGTEDTLWISVVASGMTSATSTWTATGTTAPANFTDRVDTNRADDSTIGRVEGAVAFRQQNAASQDVGTAGVDTSNARNSALVIAVRPPVAAPIQVDPTAGALTLTGVAPTVAVTNNILVEPTAAALTLTGVAPTVTAIGTAISLPTAGALTLTTATPTVTAIGTATSLPTAATLSLVGVAPSVQVVVDAQPTAAALTLTGAVPTVETPSLTLPTAATLSLAGTAPFVEAIGTAESLPTAGSIALLGAPPDVEAIGTAESLPTAASLSLVGVAPIVELTVEAHPSAASLSLSGVAPDVEAIGTAESLPTPAALTLVGATPPVDTGAGVTSQPTPASLSLAGAVPSVIAIGTATSLPTAASLTLTRGTPSVVAVGTASSQPTAASLSIALATPSVTTSANTFAFPTPASLLVMAMAPDVTITEGAFAFPTPAQLAIVRATPLVVAIGTSLPIHVGATVGQSSGVDVSVTSTRWGVAVGRIVRLTANVQGTHESDVDVEA